MALASTLLISLTVAAVVGSRGQSSPLTLSKRSGADNAVDGEPSFGSLALIGNATNSADNQADNDADTKGEKKADLERMESRYSAVMLEKTMVVASECKPSQKEALVIAPDEIVRTRKELLASLGFCTEQVLPVVTDESCAQSNHATGIFYAHQNAWKRVAALGKKAMVLEADFSITDNPDAVKQLQERIMTLYKQDDDFTGLGTCLGKQCLTAYYMSPAAAQKLLDQTTFPSGICEGGRTWAPVDDYVLDECHDKKFKCSWETQPTLPGLFGDGLFQQDRTHLKGYHTAGNGVIADGEIPDTVGSAHPDFAKSKVAKAQKTATESSGAVHKFKEAKAKHAATMEKLKDAKAQNVDAMETITELQHKADVANNNYAAAKKEIEEMQIQQEKENKAEQETRMDEKQMQARLERAEEEAAAAKRELHNSERSSKTLNDDLLLLQGRVLRTGAVVLALCVACLLRSLWYQQKPKE